jgi:DNA-binding response OmpR family regulator
MVQPGTRGPEGTIGAEAAQRRHRILVTDDNVDAAASLAMMLEIMGHEVRTAHDGLEAVEVAATFRPDIILLDIGMPKLDGFEACRRIRGQDWAHDVFMLALTGWGQDADRIEARKAGFDEHLVKPVDPTAFEKLLAGIRSRVATPDRRGGP